MNRNEARQMVGRALIDAFAVEAGIAPDWRALLGAIDAAVAGPRNAGRPRARQEQRA